MDSLSWTFYKLKRKFKQLGYSTVTTQELRDFVETFLWKRQKPNTKQEQKQMILQITPNQYFDYKTMQIQMDKSTTLQSIDLDDLQ